MCVCACSGTSSDIWLRNVFMEAYMQCMSRERDRGRGVGGGRMPKADIKQADENLGRPPKRTNTN